MNETFWLGVGTPGSPVPAESMPQNPGPEWRKKWSVLDIKQANALLDKIGLNKKDAQGFRLRTDNGQRLRIQIIAVQAFLPWPKHGEMIADQWKKVGIKLLFKPQTRDNFRLRTFSGDSMMTAYAGITTAVPTVDTSPKEFAPTMQGGLQWSRWGMFVESKGKQGEKCDLPDACQLLDLVHDWATAPEEAGRRAAWEKILEINMEEVFTIGTVNGILQPIVVSPKLHNVPKEGYYAWDPGGYIGLYKPDTFWLSQ